MSIEQSILEKLRTSVLRNSGVLDSIEFIQRRSVANLYIAA